LAQSERLDEQVSGRSAEAEKEAYPSNFYAWYCVFVLFGIYINSFLDRQILSLLVPPIKADLGLSDTQMGFLGGPAFALFYILAGLPIGWLADRMSRRLLIGLGQVFWAAATFAFGLARNFGQMAAARIGVGIGESTLSPSAYSLITDLFPPNRLAFALSVYGMGIYVGGGLASLVGGYALDAMGVRTGPGAESVRYVLPVVGERAAWQVVFFVVALPTLPLTILLLTVREPLRRGASRARAAAGQLRPAGEPIGRFLAYFRAHRATLLCHHVGFAFLSFSGYGAAFWTPALFMRVHDWELAFVGKALGWLTILVGPAGTLCGGWLADRMLERGYTDARVRLALIAALGWLPFGALYPLMPTGLSSFVLLIPATFLAASFWGVAPAAIQQLVPNQMRGQASAVYLFVVNLLGLAFGPQLLALLTDYVFQDENKVHWSLATVGVGAHLLAALFLYLCLRRFRASLADTARWQQQRA
jgi:MFS family permease